MDEERALLRRQGHEDQQLQHRQHRQRRPRPRVRARRPWESWAGHEPGVVALLGHSLHARGWLTRYPLQIAHGVAMLLDELRRLQSRECQPPPVRVRSSS